MTVRVIYVTSPMIDLYYHRGKAYTQSINLYASPAFSISKFNTLKTLNCQASRSYSLNKIHNRLTLQKFRTENESLAQNGFLHHNITLVFLLLSNYTIRVKKLYFLLSCPILTKDWRKYLFPASLNNTTYRTASESTIFKKQRLV